MTLTREQIIETIRAAAEPLAEVNAMWLGGSDAFGLADVYSDCDIQLDVADGTEEEAFVAIESALELLSPIELRWVLPIPTWHGHHQRFYKLRDANSYSLVDLLLIARSSERRLNERELHGEPVVLFDKLGVIHSAANDKEALRAQLAEQLKDHKLRASMFEGFFLKELKRGNAGGAFMEHVTFVIRRLQQVLRMRYSPHRFEFSLRYAVQDLPPEVTKELTELCFVRDLDDLAMKHARAMEWFNQEIEQLDIAELEL